MLSRNNNDLLADKSKKTARSADSIQRIEERTKKCRKKIILIEGDTSQMNLGLSEKYRARIKDTDLIFHSAASVRFMDNIRLIVNTNIRGTRDLLLLAQEMESLRAFVYVSTAYSYCVYKILKEDQLDLITPKLLGNWPNTYAYSKAICKDTVRQYSNGIPACIVRPSIVVATGKELIAGWISNLYGIIGIAVESATGVLHTLYCNENFICNIIPVDYVVKNIIAAAWYVAQKQLLKIYRNIEKFKYVMNYFTFTEWEFTNVTNDNVLKLWDKLSVVDKHKFFFNVSDIDWECFSNTYIKGVRVYLLKDPMETVDESRPFYRR
ncbi:fatty acyl-CoA reductase wat-like [Polistes fuscatus]|uniref:fatty acyl-CoA reductase wat-like n=1 Tax=Polistes fuscatus TaxID=30207 RepID=UPI001CA7E75B|nr:fatty acyl-CoA reductase wat-like [Polistes fuscatus]